MYAIVRSGGKQLKVAAGDVVRIEKPAGEKIAKGEKLALSGASVILVSGDAGVRTGTDALKGVTVQAKVLGTVRTPQGPRLQEEADQAVPAHQGSSPDDDRSAHRSDRG